MRYGDVVFHNATDVREIGGYDGVMPQRVPEDVRTCLNQDARHRMLAPTDVEIRVVPKGDFEITLEAPNGGIRVVPYWGPFRADERYTVTYGRETLHVEMPDKVSELDPSRYEYVSPRVCRLVLSGTTGMRGDWVLYQGIDGDVRPPEPEELPDTRYLVYGTSITEGGTSSPFFGYPQYTARRLDADVLNLATAGSAHAEPELADHIAARGDWDVVSLALSVNMLEFSVEEFRTRAEYMLTEVAERNPDKPVVAISHFSNQTEVTEGLEEGTVTSKDAAFRDVIREVVQQSSHENLYHVAGTELLTDVGGLSTDTVHPSLHGHLEISERLAGRLADLL